MYRKCNSYPQGRVQFPIILTTVVVLCRVLDMHCSYPPKSGAAYNPR